ncbi:MAG: hypothetical protein OEZ06_32725 [Myxococcales bacterium]|nr:hypothetical protein [Myxococcales bacterium]
MAVSKDEILAVLDRCCREFTFPMLDNGYVYLAATRMTAFRSDDGWALVIEVFGFSPRAGLPDTFIYTFGSQIRNRKAADDFVTPEAHAQYLESHQPQQSATPSPWRRHG